MDILNPQGEDTSSHYGILNLERRKYPRFSVDLPIEYYRTDRPAGSFGRVLDISQGGLLIYFYERMEIGQHLRLKLSFSFGSELNTIEFLAEVVWVDLIVDEDSLDNRTGVKFVDISPDDMIKLRNFLLSLSQPS